ncbi:MAG TPA: Uma2 family endonuclease [Pirellulales bacterium]|jgi:Uma2 family endonuclease|nr:Uma2 family endonuclease [Pirellulales bacterium]
MATLITDPKLEQQLRAERAERGGDRFDEVWEGTYLMNPIPNPEHMALQGNLVWAFKNVLIAVPAIVYPGINVSDRADDWTKNYRCPDVAVVLPGGIAQERAAYYLGGPDFIVEIISPHDRSREKISFYGQIGVRELLLVDRDPWGLELYRLQGGELKPAGESRLEQPDILRSAVLPLSLRFVPGDPRPQIEVRHADGVQRWHA